MSVKRYHIVATCFSKQGKVLGTATNQYNKSHPLAKLYSLKAGLSEQRCYIHAELGAILKSGDKQVHSILVQRFHKDGSMANAFPCKSCQLMLKDFRVRKIVYTHQDKLKEFLYG